MYVIYRISDMWQESNEIMYKKNNPCRLGSSLDVRLLTPQFVFHSLPFLIWETKGSSKGPFPIKFCIVAHSVVVALCDAILKGYRCAVHA